MTLKELQGVLCGMVTLYEDMQEPAAEVPEYRDLYCGMSREIPNGLLDREVFIAGPRDGRKGATLDIELTAVHKKAHKKSPA